MHNTMQNIARWAEKVASSLGSTNICISYENSGWTITSPDSPISIRLPIQVDFYSVDRDLCFSEVNLNKYGITGPIEQIVPAPGLNSRYNVQLMKAEDTGVTHFYYDIVGLMYWSLNRIEEINAKPHEKDKHGRFMAKFSHAFRYGYLDRPWVDEWVFILIAILKNRKNSFEESRNSFKVLPSHDIDLYSKYRHVSLGEGIKRSLREVKNNPIEIVVFLISKLPRNVVDVDDPYDKYSYIMSLSEKNQLKSSFYFMTGQGNSPFDGDYQISQAHVKKTIREMHFRGHEIGLHPSYGSYRNAEEIARQGKYLFDACKSVGVYQDVWGGRMHFLQWEMPITTLAWQDAGFNYESTLGYAEFAGFRCGTCHDYTPFNFITKDSMKILIRPLILMDVTLFGKMYMNLPLKDSICIIDKLKDRCRKVGGNFTVLWHNSQLDTQLKVALYNYAISSKIGEV